PPAEPAAAFSSPPLSAGGSHRIVAVNGNRAPTAVIGATPSAGLPPLDVQFSSAGSSDPDGDPITFLWDFGDGSPPSTSPNPLHTYTVPGPHTAQLTVSDGKLVPGPATATIDITIGPPPQITSVSPGQGFLFRAGDTIDLDATATDPDGDALTFAWRIDLHHQTHTHPFIANLPGATQSFV